VSLDFRLFDILASNKGRGRNEKYGQMGGIQGTPYLFIYSFAIKSQSKREGKRSNKKD
jgi:hypothetical protein